LSQLEAASLSAFVISRSPTTKSINEVTERPENPKTIPSRVKHTSSLSGLAPEHIARENLLAKNKHSNSHQSHALLCHSEVLDAYHPHHPLAKQMGFYPLREVQDEYCLPTTTPTNSDTLSIAKQFNIKV
jgi:hypothetical protein